MTERSENPADPDQLNENEMAWLAAHMPEMRESIRPERILITYLAIALGVGLAAHIGGYLLGQSTTGEPLGLLSELLGSLGMALWTGVVLVVFVQVLPESKRRSSIRWLSTFEARLRERRPPTGGAAPRD